MNHAWQGKLPSWYWLVAAVALLWSLAGCFACYMQIRISPEDMAQLPAAQREIWQMMPGWVVAAYVFAVLSGLLGSLGLLLRKTWSLTFFILSLIGVLLQFGWTFLATPIMSTVGPSAIPFPAVIVLIAIAEIWFAGDAKRRGWLD